MQTYSAKAISHPNIAFIKYWGNADPILRVPANGSISMNLTGLETVTSVSFSPDLPADQLIINGERKTGAPLERVERFLDIVRNMASSDLKAQVISENNFPTGAGIASSASAFSALSLAASAALGLGLSLKALSCLARRGSGSACRSLPDGFTEWYAGSGDDDSFAESIAPPDHWQLTDCIAIVETAHKPVGSSEGHQLAGSSPFQAARVASAPERLDTCRRALLDKDFRALADIVETDSDMMHAVMMTSRPPLFYWEPASLTIMKSVKRWRSEGLQVCYTLDAGANVHVICAPGCADETASLLQQLSGVADVLRAEPAPGARLLD